MNKILTPPGSSVGHDIELPPEIQKQIAELHELRLQVEILSLRHKRLELLEALAKRHIHVTPIDSTVETSS